MGSPEKNPVQVVFYGPLRREMGFIVDTLAAQTTNFVIARAGWGEQEVEKIRDPMVSMVVVGEDLADPLLLDDLRRMVGTKALLVVATPGSTAEGDLKMHSGDGIADTVAVLETAAELRNVILDLFADMLRRHEAAGLFEIDIEWPEGSHSSPDVLN